MEGQLNDSNEDHGRVAKRAGILGDRHRRNEMAEMYAMNEKARGTRNNVAFEEVVLDMTLKVAGS